MHAQGESDGNSDHRHGFHLNEQIVAADVGQHADLGETGTCNRCVTLCHASKAAWSLQNRVAEVM